ncbi:hypothetical protein J4573_51015 [Actinomadura barringtoniae]|uniref:HEAT repeat domain-containing protein n=1 Tax=Actinomadura barringtoniae TaxID=1427535 RepID=A0A939PSL6_9ACTN|nr:hypothetical protein [Actinomadura barringtoniae]MBO2455489.1 hypothetical protein [Actinomadura barringtoniae]
MRVEELLAEIEPLSHGERCRRLALHVGRGLLSDQLATDQLTTDQPATDQPVSDELAELGALGYYERSLALLIASAAKNRPALEHLAAAMRDPAADLAQAAISWSARLGVGVEAFAALLDDAPAATRTAAYRAIRRWRRADLAEALIERVAGRWGEAEAAALLPACSEDVARERLGALSHAVPNWKSFGRAHPGLMLDHADAELASLPAATQRFWWWHAPGIAAAIPYDPSRVIGLLERHWTEGPVPQAIEPHLGVLMDADPQRVLRLLLAESHRPYLSLRRRSLRERIARLDEADIAEVARAVRSDDYALLLLLKVFPPSRRERIFELAMDGIDLSTAELDEALLNVLPAGLRTAHARRMLRLRRVAETPHTYWRTQSFLPFDEALPVLGAVTRRQDADERASGYADLIACAGRSRDPQMLTRLFDALGRLRNEQDPVRSIALGALARIPGQAIRVEHGEAFLRLTDDALAARDCSYATRDALGAIARQICLQGAIRNDHELLAVGLDMITKLTGHVEHIGFGRLDTVLRRGSEHDLVRALAPRLAKSGKRGNHRLALNLARALGRRAYDVPALQEALEVATGVKDTSIAKIAISLWLAAPRTRAERVAVLLQRDASAVTLSDVLAVVATDRTDLLSSAALAGTSPEGRFWRPNVVFVPSAQRAWMRRWTARQRADYLLLQHLVARDEGTTSSRRGEAVRAIGEVPGIGAEELRPYLGDDELRRIALTAAPWIATPQDMLPELLQAASGDDAHVSVYAATRAARFVPPSALAAHLGPVMTDGKITARKEALRILLHNRVPDAMTLIAAAWDDPGQHRDVRAAIASALRTRLGDPEAMRILTEAANGPRDVARQVVGTSPIYVEERHRDAYAALVLEVARSADPEAREVALPALPAWAPWAPEAPTVLASLVTDLDVTHWRPALDALVACAANGSGTADLASAASTLATASTSASEPDAEEERDIPASQRLAALVEATLTRAAGNREAAEPAIRALDDRLPEPLASELLAATIRWQNAADKIDALAARDMGGVLAISRVAGFLAYGPNGEEPDWMPCTPIGAPEPEDVLPHAVRLASRGDLPGGLFACALAGHHGEAAGWPEEWRAVLRGLRAHSHPDVVFAARAVLTAEE